MISQSVKDACFKGSLEEVIYIYDNYLSIPDTTNLKEIDYVILQEQIDLLLSIFQETCHLNIMIWIYNKLDKYLNKDSKVITINREDLFVFWIETFKNATFYGRYDLVKWLFNKSQHNIFGHMGCNDKDNENALSKQCLHTDDCCSFRNACCQGHVETAELLYDLGFMTGWHINLHTNNEWCFYWGCQSGNLEMVKWLYHKSKSISEPFQNIVDIYHLLKEDETSLTDNKTNVLEWFSELQELEGIATDWTLVDDDDFKLM